MFKEKVEPGNLSIDLTETLVRFGYEHDLLVLVEGFYETDIYGQMLERLKKLFAPQVFAYYYDLSFEETFRRHQTRVKQEEFSPADMKRWWKDRDFLGWEEESFFTDEDSLEAALTGLTKILNKKTTHKLRTRSPMPVGCFLLSLLLLFSIPRKRECKQSLYKGEP